jgi:hypothetical protein
MQLLVYFLPNLMFQCPLFIFTIPLCLPNYSFQPILSYPFTTIILSTLKNAESYSNVILSAWSFEGLPIGLFTAGPNEPIGFSEKGMVCPSFTSNLNKFSTSFIASPLAHRGFRDRISTTNEIYQRNSTMAAIQHTRIGITSQHIHTHTHTQTHTHTHTHTHTRTKQNRQCLTIEVAWGRTGMLLY